MERPQSPLPKRKGALFNYMTSLARYHFTDPDDLQLLNKLIQEENEFVLSCFDVFESDKDHDNLIDSLNRILEKSKQMGLHMHSVTASSFYNQGIWSRSNNQTPLGGNSSQLNQKSLSSQSRQQPYYQNPYISKWDERNYVGQEQFPTFSQSQERPHGAVGGRRSGNNPTPPPHTFQQTTVHNVALIPNYFSSGEEEAMGQSQQRQAFAQRGAS
mmetsp:Transcript_38717/g.37062  ORF Transcript_38717/g.37062 Transcript_38717/m.37062 type:complete len:214 (+) Transcript_38717:958-1599(+)